MTSAAIVVTGGTWCLLILLGTWLTLNGHPYIGVLLVAVTMSARVTWRTA
jgi:hypothetical protein